MTDIQNTEYITINKDGVFVGGKPATHYRGEKIPGIYFVKENFTVIQRRNPEVQEFHCGAFETKGEYAEPGTPSGNFGPNAWCRVKLFDGRVGPWVFFHTYGSASDCANFCAYFCGSNVRHRSFMRSAMLNFATKNKPDTTKDKADTQILAPESELKHVLQKIDLSKYVGKKLVELNGYVITVQKQK